MTRFSWVRFCMFFGGWRILVNLGSLGSIVAMLVACGLPRERHYLG